MHHLVAHAPWEDARVLKVARAWVLDPMERHGAVAAWVIDDTGIPKKGTHSVGAARQDCGALGKQDNCQVAVSVSPVNEAVSVPAAYRLYLPEAWAEDRKRRTTVWRPGAEPLPARHHRGPGRPPTRLRRSSRHRPVGLDALARELPASAWRSVTWRQGTRATMRSRFACLRVRPAHRDENLHRPREVEWLLIEWPRGEPGPTKRWLSTMPLGTAVSQLVRLATIRWRIQRDYEELKSEFGLDHFEGRGWRGFHHHGTLCVAAYAFVAAERARLSPLSLCPSSTPLVSLKDSARGALPPRPERHVAGSVTTILRHHGRLLLQAGACLWCGSEARVG